jgi:hypothetical protein
LHHLLLAGLPAHLCENALFAVIRAIRFPAILRGHLMKRFVEGLDRGQSTLFPASLDDYVTEETRKAHREHIPSGLSSTPRPFSLVLPD